MIIQSSDEDARTHYSLRFGPTGETTYAPAAGMHLA